MTCEHVGDLRLIDHDGDAVFPVYACWACPGHPLVLDPDAHQHTHHPSTSEETGPCPDAS